MLESFGVTFRRIPCPRMQKKRPWSSWVIAFAAVAAGGQASAAGFGAAAGGAGALLGQPLDFAVQLRLEPGETLTPACLSAEVTVGERRLPAAQVRTLVETMAADLALVRVISSQAIDEPVVGIQLNAVCNLRLSRRYVVLADPPTASQPVAQSVAPSVAQPPPPSQAAAPLELTPALEATAEPPRATSSAGMLVPVAATRTVAARVPAGDLAAAAAPAAKAARAAVAALARPERLVQERRSAAAARSDTTRRPRAEPTPRLRLEPAEPSAEEQIVEQAIQAVAEAASAARAAASTASATSARIASLERTVEQLRAEARTSREQAAALRAQLEASDGGGRSVWPLALAAAVFAGIAGWMAWRLNAVQREQQRGWRAMAGSAAALLGDEPARAGRAAGPATSDAAQGRQITSPIPFVTAEVKLPSPAAPPARPRSGSPAWPPPAPPDPWVPPVPPTASSAPPPAPPAASAARGEEPAPSPIEQTQPLTARPEPAPDAGPAARAAEPGAPRDVSIEELIDLEQQAEFFVVLGQDEAAIELLVDHLRQTGGGSPLPYLKLLEIYRRRGDRNDYERTRSRFNHRFNAYAPDWGADLLAGLALEDYAGVIPRLQQVWPRPLDAMAELEALLFRKSRGELFDLPAYREVLFLYSLARDLLDREAADTGNVDVLLPIAGGGDFSNTTPKPYLGLDAESGFGHHDFEERPTAPLDFDLSSEPDRPTSIFDPLDGVASPRQR